MCGGRHRADGGWRIHASASAGERVSSHGSDRALPAHEPSGRDHPVDERIPRDLLASAACSGPGLMEFSLENAPCSALVFTDDGHVASVNARLCRLLGYEREELVGQHLQAIFSPGARVFYQTHLFPMLKLQGEVEEVYLALRAKSGEEIPFLLNARRQERDGRNENDCILVRMRQRTHFEGELLKAKRAA